MNKSVNSLVLALSAVTLMIVPRLINGTAQAGAIGCYDECNKFCGWPQRSAEGASACAAGCAPGAPPLPPPAPGCPVSEEQFLGETTEG